MSADKTNVMRSLDQKKIKYKVHEYKESGAVSGVEVAAALGQDPKRAFKTLVTIGNERQSLRVYGSCSRRTRP